MVWFKSFAIAYVLCISYASSLALLPKLIPFKETNEDCESLITTHKNGLGCRRMKCKEQSISSSFAVVNVVK